MKHRGLVLQAAVPILTKALTRQRVRKGCTIFVCQIVAMLLPGHPSTDGVDHRSEDVIRMSEGKILIARGGSEDAMV